MDKKKLYEEINRHNQVMMELRQTIEQNNHLTVGQINQYVDTSYEERLQPVVISEVEIVVNKYNELMTIIFRTMATVDFIMVTDDGPILFSLENDHDMNVQLAAKHLLAVYEDIDQSYTAYYINKHGLGDKGL